MGSNKLNYNWIYPKADVDPAHRKSGVLVGLNEWFREDGTLIDVEDTRHQNLLNLQIYIDEKLRSDLSNDKLQYYKAWAEILSFKLRFEFLNSVPPLS